jgi:hypothetical protein
MVAYIQHFVEPVDSLTFSLGGIETMADRMQWQYTYT